MKKMCILLLLLAIASLNLAAEEGMWTFDNPPSKAIMEKYGFEMTQAWLDTVRLASVRFMDGGSGSFISPNGLVLTNHHVAMGQLQKMSTAEKNYVNTGFYAATQDQEVPCSDLEVNVLVDMKNITADVLKSTKGLKGEASIKAREAYIAKIEQKQQKKTGLTANVVSLYRGGEYWLYSYKKYTDVRLVMAPERQIAFFGGDYDNFTYPRYDLDCTFFRVYEKGKPVNSPAYLRWNLDGAGENELVFVSGHPGSTNRLNTYAQMDFMRSLQYPFRLEMIERRLETLYTYSKRGPEEARRALGQIFGLENAKKAMGGEFKGLNNQEIMDTLKQQETVLRQKVDENPTWKSQYAQAWSDIESAIAKQKEVADQTMFRGISAGGRLSGIAQQIVFYASEITKKDSDRLDGFHDSQLDRFRFRIFSPAPVYLDLEEVTWVASLEWAVSKLGADDPFLAIILDGKSPAEAVKSLLEGTKLTDVAVRRALIEGGVKALSKCEDPLIKVALKLEPMLREQEKWTKEQINAVVVPASEAIAAARFAVYGKSTYPDATFTLRLSYGSVKGYEMNGSIAPYKTTIYGLYDRSASFDGKGDFALPQRFLDRQATLDMKTPVNFVTTCDIIGGNSGSPVVNAKGELVGLIFDGNIESLPGRFFYEMKYGRSVAVHPAFMMEALLKLYDAKELAEEIKGQSK